MHGPKILASLDAATSAGVPAKEYKALFEQQKPVVFRGYIMPKSMDTSYEIAGHSPKWADLRNEHWKKANEPLAATLFNVTAFLERGGKGKVTNSAIKQTVLAAIRKDLRKLPVLTAQISEVVNRPFTAEEDFVAYVAFPSVRPTRNGQDPVFVEEQEATALGMAYLLSQSLPGVDGKHRRLVTPGEMAEGVGYAQLMEAMKPEHAAILNQKLGINMDAQMKVAFREDPQGTSRMVSYMMLQDKIKPEDVEERFGHEVLMAACSKENVKWLQSLRGFPEAPLADVLPRAALHLEAPEAKPKMIGGDGMMLGGVHGYSDMSPLDRMRKPQTSSGLQIK